MAFQLEADLPPVLACLKNVDTLLRCPICFDFLNIAMMTKCSHNFCSLCIRKFFSYKLQCPVCNTQAIEQDLRNNRLLDDLIVNIQAARQQFIKTTFDSPPISPKTPATAQKCKTPREKPQRCKTSVLSHFFQKKPKLSPTKVSLSDTFNHCAEERETACTRNTNEVNSHSAPTPLSAVVKEEPLDTEGSSFQLLKSVKQEDTGSYSISSAAEIAHSSSPTKDVKPVIKVECPVCSVSVSKPFINKHLDICLTRGDKKESLRSSFGKTRRPMAKLVYNLLSIQELKKKLKECHLSPQGTRDQLIKRHQNFVHMYNAQCDSLNPKSAEHIAKEVEAEEKTRNRLQGKVQPVMVFKKNQSQKEIDEMHSNYRKQHSSEFSRLITQVRGRLGTAKQAHAKDASELPSAGKIPQSISCETIKVEDGEDEREPFERINELPSSPTLSDISISSSVSDIFGPEPDRNYEETKRTSVQKRASSPRGENSDSWPVTGKRRRKT